jgi:pimeloyl-ACP methyl ester carboxylesterase
LQGDLHYDRFVSQNEEESILRIGAADAPAVILIPALFEELNRTRALMAGMMRHLAARGFACWLPDLPGTNESVRPLEKCDWPAWQDAARNAAAYVARASGRPPAIAAMRGGCLLDDVNGLCHWRFAPAEGVSLARDMERSSLIAAQDQTGDLLDLAGYPVSRPLLEAVRSAVASPVSPLRVVRLESDRAEADAKLDGPAIWRRSEPSSAPELVQALGDDLAAWIEQCAGC